MREYTIERLAERLCVEDGHSPYTQSVGRWMALRGGQWVEEYGFHAKMQEYYQRADELLPRTPAERRALSLIMATIPADA